jgi:hypothetical protein
VDLLFTDDVGDSTISGGLTYSRISAGGDFAERVASEGKNLTLEDDNGRETITQIDLNATRSRNGRFSIGNPGQYAIIETNLIAGSLTVTIQTAISGREEDAPEQGKLQVEAQDGSYLIMTIDSGEAFVEVDTDNDGEIDGTFSAEWMDLD